VAHVLAAAAARRAAHGALVAELAGRAEAAAKGEREITRNPPPQTKRRVWILTASLTGELQQRSAPSILEVVADRAAAASAAAVGGAVAAATEGRRRAVAAVGSAVRRSAVRGAVRGGRRSVAASARDQRGLRGAGAGAAVAHPPGAP